MVPGGGRQPSRPHSAKPILIEYTAGMYGAGLFPSLVVHRAARRSAPWMAWQPWGQQRPPPRGATAAAAAATAAGCGSAAPTGAVAAIAEAAGAGLPPPPLLPALSALRWLAGTSRAFGGTHLLSMLSRLRHGGSDRSRAANERAISAHSRSTAATSCDRGPMNSAHAHKRRAGSGKGRVHVQDEGPARVHGVTITAHHLKLSGLHTLHQNLTPSGKPQGSFNLHT